MMALFVIVGLILQALTLTLMFRRLGRRWLVHAGAVFIVLATVYHGLNEIVLWLFPERDPYRRFVSSDHVGQFVLWISVAILLFTVTYLGALRGEPKPVLRSETDWQLARIGRVFDWRIMLVALTPLMILTLAGNSSPGSSLDLSHGLAFQFTLLVLPLASLAMISRLGPRFFFPVVLVQSTAIAAVGARLEILIAAAVVLYALARIGIAINTRQLTVVAIAFIGFALIITSGRAAQGRFSSAAAGSLRVDSLIAGIGNLGSGTTWDLVSADLGYRLDGNSFGAMELEALSNGMPVLGPRPLVNDLFLAVPSFLNPDKTSSPIEVRSEKAYAEAYLDLPLPLVAPNTRQDILPTQLGAIIGFAGPWSLLLSALLLGAVFGIADRWLLRRLTPSRLLIGVGLLSCVLFYEGSWDVYSVTFRGILVLLPIVWILQSTRSRRQMKWSATDRLPGRPSQSISSDTA